MNRSWLVAALSVGGGLALAALLSSEVLPDPVVYARTDLSLLALFATGALAGGIGLGWAISGWIGGTIQRQVAQAQATQAADRRRFLSRLDHELKNPLTAIRVGLANLVDAPPSAQQETIHSITLQAGRLSRLIADLHKLTELETRPLEHGPVDMADLLNEVVAVGQERAAGTRQVILTLPQVPWPLPPVAGDRDVLFLAIHNLLDNALKFTQAQDKVEVRAFEDGPSVVVEVADSGPGIEATDLPYVWGELYRGQATQGVPGNGLGLALVRAITVRHGGQITLRSRPGHGTVVTLRLPIGTSGLREE